MDEPHDEGQASTEGQCLKPAENRALQLLEWQRSRSAAAEAAAREKRGRSSSVPRGAGRRQFGPVGAPAANEKGRRRAGPGPPISCRPVQATRPVKLSDEAACGAAPPSQIEVGARASAVCPSVSGGAGGQSSVRSAQSDALEEAAGLQRKLLVVRLGGVLLAAEREFQGVMDTATKLVRSEQSGWAALCASVIGAPLTECPDAVQSECPGCVPPQ